MYITSYSIRIVLLSRYINIYDTMAPMSGLSRECRIVSRAYVCRLPTWCVVSATCCRHIFGHVTDTRKYCGGQWVETTRHLMTFDDISLPSSCCCCCCFLAELLLFLLPCRLIKLLLLLLPRRSYVGTEAHSEVVDQNSCFTAKVFAPFIPKNKVTVEQKSRFLCKTGDRNGKCRNPEDSGRKQEHAT